MGAGTQAGPGSQSVAQPQVIWEQLEAWLAEQSVRGTNDGVTVKQLSDLLGLHRTRVCAMLQRISKYGLAGGGRRYRLVVGRGYEMRVDGLMQRKPVYKLEELSK